MSEIHILLLCGLLFMPIAVILAMGVFWTYIWVKDRLCGVDKEEKEVTEAIKKLTKSIRASKRCGLYKEPEH